MSSIYNPSLSPSLLRGVPEVVLTALLRPGSLPLVRPSSPRSKRPGRQSSLPFRGARYRVREADVCVCVCECVWVRVYVYVGVRVHVCRCLRVCVLQSEDVYVRKRSHVCVYTSVYTCVCVLTCVYLYGEVDISVYV